MVEKTIESRKKETNKIIKRTIITASAIAISFSLIIPKMAYAWSNNNYIPTNPNNISSPYTASRSYPGIVISVRHVKINYNDNAGNEGALIGGGLGALVGSQIGKGAGKIASEIVGGIGGAIAGEHVGKHFAEGIGTQIVVRMQKNGNIETITEPSNINLYPGERVLVVQSQSNRVRVIPNTENSELQLNSNQVKKNQAQQVYAGKVLTSISDNQKTIVYVKMQNNGKTFRFTVPGYEKFNHNEKVLVNKNSNNTYTVIPEN